MDARRAAGGGLAQGGAHGFLHLISRFYFSTSPENHQGGKDVDSLDGTRSLSGATLSPSPSLSLGCWCLLFSKGFSFLERLERLADTQSVSQSAAAAAGFLADTQELLDHLNLNLQLKLHLQLL